MRSKSPSQRRQLVCFHSDTVFLTIYSNLLYSLYTHTLWKRSVQKYTSYGALSKTIHFLSVFCEAGVVQQSTEAQAGVVQDELIIPLELFIPPLYLYSPGWTVNWKYAILLKWMILSICRLFCASSWNKTSHQSCPYYKVGVADLFMMLNTQRGFLHRGMSREWKVASFSATSCMTSGCDRSTCFRGLACKCTQILHHLKRPQ